MTSPEPMKPEPPLPLGGRHHRARPAWPQSFRTVMLTRRGSPVREECVGRRPWSDEGDTPERRAQVAERLRQLGEMVGHRTVEAEVSPVEWDDDNRLLALADALTARPELIDPTVSTDLSRRVIVLTVTVAAPDPEAARTVAAHALDEEIGALGLRRV
jgi:hypothetical protein